MHKVGCGMYFAFVWWQVTVHNMEMSDNAWYKHMLAMYNGTLFDAPESDATMGFVVLAPNQRGPRRKIFGVE